MLKEIRLTSIFLALAFLFTGCLPIPSISQGQPDLVWARNWTIEPFAPVAGDRLHIKHSFRNAGEAATPSEFAIRLEIKKGTASLYGQPVLVRDAVQPGEWRTVDISPDFAIPEPGGYIVTMLLDPGGAVAESTKENNRWGSDLIQVPDLSNTTIFNKGEDEAALARAEKDIEKYRKGDVTVTLVNTAGRPRSGLTVEYNQTQHTFLFGGYGTRAGENAWGAMKEAGTNYATVDFPWAALEPSPGDFRLDSVWTEPIRKFGFTGMGHALVYFAPRPTPYYVAKMTFEQLRDAIYPHVFKVVSTYKQDISIWNVYNEPVYLGEKVVDLTSKQTIEVIQKGASAIRDADPDASILVNIFNAGAEIKGPDPFEFVKEAVQTGVDFDIIGLELYYNAVMTERLNAHPRRTLKAQAELIDKYSAFGKKIIITEISVPSASVGKGYWDQSWSEDLQAEYLKSAYTLFFSRPQVQGITWWDIADGSWSFIYHGALINAQGKPKKSYYALKQLIKNWTTSGTAITNENGQINIRGFGGVYEVTMTDPRTGKSQKQEIEIQEQTQNTIRLVWNS